MSTTPREARTDKLIQARARDSATKTERAIATAARLQASGQQVTFARVAQDAAVSTWFTYNNEAVAAAIRDAQRDQAEHGLHATPSSLERVSAASLRTDLEHSRAEVRTLRDENQRLRQSLAARLGVELSHPDPTELAGRLRQVEQHNTELASQLSAANAQSRQAEAKLTTTQDELTAARESLRRMIKQGTAGP